MARRYVGTRWSFGKTIITIAVFALGMLASPIITSSITLLIIVFAIRHYIQQRKLR